MATITKPLISTKRGEYSQLPTGAIRPERTGLPALNGYLIGIAPDASYVRDIPASCGYANFLEVPHGARVPVLMDGLRFDLFPIETDGPPRMNMIRGRVRAEWHGFVSTVTVALSAVRLQMVRYVRWGSRNSGR